VSRQTVRSLFLGTPAAAVPTLARLAGLTDVIGAVTRPDKPRGRSARPLPSPVKEEAGRLGIPVLQPSDGSELNDLLERVGPIDVGVVVAYGALIKGRALGIPSGGFLNVHFSLLPRWRGAAPVTAAILAGDEETGVTLMHLDAGLDTGPIISARGVVIGRDENAGELTARLAKLGAEVLAQSLFDWLNGNLAATPQPLVGVTHAPKLAKNDLVLDLSRDAAALERQVRALAPQPGAVLTLGESRLRVLSARSLDRDIPSGRLTISDGEVLVGTGAGALELLIIQPAGKQPMAAAAWMRGRRGSPDLTGR
jgi:methionyl-tRNA formyltransferase